MTAIGENNDDWVSKIPRPKGRMSGADEQAAAFLGEMISSSTWAPTWSKC